MNRIKVSDNFYLDEFIPREIYTARPDHGRSLLDARVIYVAQWLRDITGRPVRLNNWWDGGKLQERGLRSWDTKTGARWSQHKFGRAGDCSVDGLTPTQVHGILLKNEAFLIKNAWITTLEDPSHTPTWTHFDCRWTGLNRILIVKP
jgi:hypothetical protein